MKEGEGAIGMLLCTWAVIFYPYTDRGPSPCGVLFLVRRGIAVTVACRASPFPRSVFTRSRSPRLKPGGVVARRHCQRRFVGAQTLGPFSKAVTQRDQCTAAVL